MQKFLIKKVQSSSSSLPSCVNTPIKRPYRLGIVGSRDFDDVALFERTMTNYVEKHGMPAEVVSGGAAGADTMGAKWATKQAPPVKLTEHRPNFRSDVPKYINAQAALDRNTLIVHGSDKIIAFHVNGSTGTLDTIKKAQKHLGVNNVFVVSIA